MYKTDEVFDREMFILTFIIDSKMLKMWCLLRELELSMMSDN